MSGKPPLLVPFSALKGFGIDCRGTLSVGS